MWLDLFASLSEALSHVVAFSLAAHNSNVPLFAHDFNAAFNTPKEFRGDA